MANAEDIYSELDQSFRDSVSTVDKEGKRVWVYPQKPKGKLHIYRVLVAAVCLVLLFGMPFIRLNGEPLLLLNVLERKFVFFGMIFGPQDFFLLGLSMLSFMVFIVLFTVVYGRVWCGWTCPQTIFMEMVFRKIEYFIEGDANKQRALKKAPWSFDKISKKAIKHLVFFLISFIIANTFLAYIIGVEELFTIIREPLQSHWAGFSSLLAFTGMFYWVFAFFREQVCTVVCPYGRLQGVLLDKNSIVVAYDYMRGEKRGKLHKNEERTLGDCIDCHQCVAVCPTGIDIRNGTQLECVNCTACIDACDHIMDRVGFPRGLIRFASEKGIADKERLRITPRIVAYTVILFALLGVLSFALISRTDTATTVLRTPGMMYQEQPDGRISNLYNYKIINNTHKEFDLMFKVESMENVEIKLIGIDGNIKLKSEDALQGSMFIMINADDLKERKTRLEIGLYAGEKKLEEIETIFMGPVN